MSGWRGGQEFAAPDDGSKRMQMLVTFVVGGIGVTTVWPYLDGVSRGLVVVFSIMAVLSIKNGTWMESHRKIRRAQRETRRETLREAKRAVWG